MGLIYNFGTCEYPPLIVPNWPEWQSLNCHNFKKNDHRENIFSNFSLRQEYFSNDILKIRHKWLFKKSKFVWRKKFIRAKIFHDFRYKCQNYNWTVKHIRILCLVTRVEVLDICYDFESRASAVLQLHWKNSPEQKYSMIFVTNVRTTNEQLNIYKFCALLPGLRYSTYVTTLKVEQVQFATEIPRSRGNFKLSTKSKLINCTTSLPNRLRREKIWIFHRLILSIA